MDTGAPIYAKDASNFMLAHKRLSSASGLRLRPEAVARLTAKVEHLEMRAQLPPSALRRWPIVLRALAAGRYHRFSSGWESFAKDLWRGGRGNARLPNTERANPI
jgi:hypothetical protein